MKSLSLASYNSYTTVVLVVRRASIISFRHGNVAIDKKFEKYLETFPPLLTSMVRGKHIHESMSATSSSSVVSERTERYCVEKMGNVRGPAGVSELPESFRLRRKANMIMSMHYGEDVGFGHP